VTGRMAVFNHTGQVVTDPERSMRFYREVFGFQYWYQFSPEDEAVGKLCSLEPPLSVAAYYLTLGGLVMELIHYAGEGATAAYRPRTMNEPGLTHLSLAVDDIHATARKAVEYGGQVLEESDIGVGLMIRDPDGQLIELLDMRFRENLPPKPQE
jgi:lactoylglutathione lyase